MYISVPSPVEECKSGREAKFGELLMSVSINQSFLISLQKFEISSYDKQKIVVHPFVRLYVYKLKSNNILCT